MKQLVIKVTLHTTSEITTYTHIYYHDGDSISAIMLFSHIILTLSQPVLALARK